MMNEDDFRTEVASGKRKRATNCVFHSIQKYDIYK